MSAETTSTAFEPFALVKQRCKIAHVNTRTELHGDEPKLAIDVKLYADMHNSVLKKFHPALLDSFYHSEQQADIEPQFNPTQPRLRYPQIESIAWQLEIPRAKLRLHDVDAASNDLVMSDGKAKKFRLTMKDGGTVEMTFVVSFSDVDEDNVAKLLRVLNHEVPVSMESAAADEEKGDNFQQAELITQTPRSAEWEKANSLFDQQPADSTPLSLEDVATAMEQQAAATPAADPAPAAEEVPAAAESNVTQIAPRRVGRRVAGGGMGD